MGSTPIAWLLRMRDYGDATHQLGDKPKAIEALRFHKIQRVVLVQLFSWTSRGGKAHLTVCYAPPYDVVEAHKCSAADKQDVGGVELRVFLKDKSG